MNREEIRIIVENLLVTGKEFEVRKLGFNLGDIKNQYNEDVFFSKFRINEEKMLLRIREELKKGTIKPDIAERLLKDEGNIRFLNQHGFNNMINNYDSRIYLNPVMGDGYFKFIEEFIIRSLQADLRFEMKAVNSVGDGEERDGIIIYTEKNYLEDLTNVCLNIFNDFPELKKQFNGPPLGGIRPCEYFSVCRGIANETNKFVTYNDYINCICKQSFVYLMLKDNPDLRQKLYFKLGNDKVNDFLNYQLFYKSPQFFDDIVSKSFFEDQEIIKWVKIQYTNDKINELIEPFYSIIQKFNSMHLYGDLEHIMHPAITEETTFLNKYLFDNIVDNIKENNSKVSRVRFGSFGGSEKVSSMEEYFVTPGDIPTGRSK